MKVAEWNGAVLTNQPPGASAQPLTFDLPKSANHYDHAGSVSRLSVGLGAG